MQQLYHGRPGSSAIMPAMSFLPTRGLFWASLSAALIALALLAGCNIAAGGPAPGDPPPGDPPPASPAASAEPVVDATAAPPTATPLPRGGNLTVRLAADVEELRPWQPRSRG